MRLFFIRRLLLGILFSCGSADLSAEEPEYVRVDFSVLLFKPYKEVKYADTLTQDEDDYLPDLTLYYRPEPAGSGGPKKGAENLRPIPLYFGQRTELFNYYGAPRFSLYLSKKNGTGEVSYERVANVEIEPDATQALLILDHSPEGAFVRAVDLTPEKMPPGTLVFYNRTQKPIALKIGGSEPLPIRPFAANRTQLKGAESLRSISFAVYEKETWKIAYRTRMVLQPKERYIGLFSFEGGGHKLLLLRGI